MAASSFQPRYSRILVLGSKRVGKTSLLAAALNGDLAEDNMYNPTLRVERFYDVDRKLEFIDTPGLSKILDSDEGVEFAKDPVVKEILDTIGTRRKEVALNPQRVELDALDAYVIVHNSDRKSKEMATALKGEISKALAKRMKASNGKTKKMPIILTVHNDFKLKPSSILTMMSVKLQVPDSHQRSQPLNHAEVSKDTDSKHSANFKRSDFSVNAKTFSNIDQMLDTLADELQNSRREIEDCLPQLQLNRGNKLDVNNRASCIVEGNISSCALS